MRSRKYQRCTKLLGHGTNTVIEDIPDACHKGLGDMSFHHILCLDGHKLQYNRKLYESDKSQWKKQDDG